MKLFTKAIEAKAQAQYPLGADMEKQVIVAKFFNPSGAGTWWLMNQDPNDTDYLWGVVDLLRRSSLWRKNWLLDHENNLPTSRNLLLQPDWI